ncbi:hypothetical protein Corgl_0858 [Coriobacterium glomerans PW2]|uniref:DUF697 domain-containing protein n=1 Tax=Coriobacterium glomerans (strain ATCC 49209 / DSM 20642 / JCM 10262 / PW2) TaxID=700015 RepID=F2N7S9_CORGP|nr:hypothetical protein [Coriobacterium glomerans]AEB06971.1 hypothetical protein Corgl_0858 [Coriobacterium glomerans PW2]
MRISASKLIKGLRIGSAAKKGAGMSVRIGVYVDDTASPAVVEALRDALVPETTGGIVRVARLGDRNAAPRSDTDAIIVVSGGSEGLEDAVRRLVITGAPVVVAARSASEVPFIREDTPALGLVASDDREHLLEGLAHWILERSDKASALAANFSFMRPVASERITRATAVTNALTGAMVFMPGANYPIMTLAQIEMALNLAAVHGKGLRLERGYEIAAVVVAGLGLRGAARAIGARMPRANILTGALVAGAGTYGMGRALTALYERDVDYGPLNHVIRSAYRRARDLIAPGAGSLAKIAAKRGRSAAEGA